ncbi:DUF2516 family protein [Ruania alba]|uniref:DUF2516 family protein n=1 Tax=Ruania alba TaxID=648782 RepID=A0A1H5BAD5_9MICO|nr:DUF2516 family protein [Ruania alba]SED51375.1 Protein of unknown function [Ruania alba]
MQVIGLIQGYLFLILALAAFALALWALIDAAVRPAQAYLSADKRTKGFWLAVTGLATLLTFLAVPSGGGGGVLFLMLLGGVPAGVYLADVRPAVRSYGGGSGGSRW